MNFKKENKYRLSMNVVFEKPISVDDFRYLTENTLYEIGEPEVDWPEDIEDFEPDEEYRIPITLTAADDCDEDTVNYCLNRISREVREAGSVLGRIELAEGR